MKRRTLTVTVSVVLANCNSAEEILSSVCSLRSRSVDSVLQPENMYYIYFCVSRCNKDEVYYKSSNMKVARV